MMWTVLDMAKYSKKALLARLCRGSERRGQKGACHTAQKGMLYRIGDLEKQLIVSQIFRQAVLKTVHKIL